MPYCGLCDGAHHPRDCAATSAMQRAEYADNWPGIGEEPTELSAPPVG